MTTFATIAEAIDYVDEALSTSEGYPEDYDMEAIAREVTEWRDGRLVLVADGDEFWAAAMRHDRTNRTKAEFRATRETLGVTQQRLADDLGVKVLSVKRWESPKYPQHAPAEAWELLDMLMAKQDSAVAAALAQVREVASNMGEGPASVALPYWASQSDYMEHHYLAAESDASWTEVNATNRRVAVMLRWLGFRVRWVDGADSDIPAIG